MNLVTEKGNFELRGVTIALFRAIAMEALERNPDKTYWDMGHVMAELIGSQEILNPDCRFGIVDKDATLTFSADSSLIDMLKSAHQEIPHPKLGVIYRQVVGAKANAFLCYAYGNNFIELVEGLESFLEDEKRDPMTTYFWFDMFVHNQWHVLDHEFHWWATTFVTAVESSGETVMFLSPWEEPACLKRAWCVFEITFSEKISVAISRAQKDAFLKTLREDPVKVYKTLYTIDFEKAESHLPEDMERISAVVRSKEGGFHNINMKVAESMWGWAEKTARAHGFDLENDQMTIEQLKDLFSSGLLLSDGGKYDEANRMFERALGGFQKAAELDHPNTLGTTNKLGVLLQHQVFLEESEHTFERVLRSLEVDAGMDHPTTLDTVNNLGSLLSVLGKYDEAKPMFERALQGFENSLGSDHLSTLKTVNHLANLSTNQGELEEAKPMFERA